MKLTKKMKNLMKKKEPRQTAKEVSSTELKLTCDNCEEKFSMVQSDIVTEKLDVETEWRYFSCPNCERRFTTYVGNSKVLKLIEKRNAIRAKIQRETARRELMDQKRYLALVGEDNDLASKIKKIQAKLKEVHNIGEREVERVPSST